MSAAGELKAQARVFARAQQRVELTTLLSNPFRHAPYRWLTQHSGAGVAGAYAQLDRRHRLTLRSVWANPQGHGHGAALLRQIIADTAPHDLWLVADNRRAARFYQRHGFQLVRRELLGHRMRFTRSSQGEPSGGPTA